MSELLEIVAKRIRQCRQEKGWTLEETAARLAQASGEPFGYSRYSNWEQAARMPPAEMVLLLAKVFGKTPAWINGYTDNDSLSAVTSNYVTANPTSIQTKAGGYSALAGHGQHGVQPELCRGAGHEPQQAAVHQTDRCQHGPDDC